MHSGWLQTASVNAFALLLFKQEAPNVSIARPQSHLAWRITIGIHGIEACAAFKQEVDNEHMASLKTEVKLCVNAIEIKTNLACRVQDCVHLGIPEAEDGEIILQNSAQKSNVPGSRCHVG